MILRFLKSKPSISVSLLLHGLILIAMLFLLVIKSCRSVDEVHVFELTEITDESQERIPVSKPELWDEAPQLQAKPEVMDYQTFLKNNPKGQQKEDSSVKQKAEVLPRFKTQVALEAEPSKPAQDRKILEAYSQYIYKTINNYWDKPRSQLSSNTQIKVQFAVLGSGVIQSFKIIKSSGSVPFDQSIEAIFDTIGAFKPTPLGKKQTFTMVFRLGS